MALIVESTVDDKGWCQSMHDAILAVQKKMGAGAMEYSHSEKMKPVDAGSAARQYASQGFDIIICHGAQYKNLVDEMAGVFPNTTFETTESLTLTRIFPLKFVPTTLNTNPPEGNV